MTDERDNERRSQSIKIPVPWSSRPIEVRGLSAVLSLILVVVSLIAYALWEHKADAKEQAATVVQTLKDVAAAQNELSYLGTLTPEDKAKLKLDMPESLRRKVRDR